MARSRRKFGPLFYVTLATSCLVLAVVYGKLKIWPSIEAFWKVHHLEREWRDSRLSKAIRLAAADKLVEFGPAAVPSFLSVGNDLDDPMRSEAFSHLARIMPAPPEAIAACLKALKTDKDPQVRVSAVELLGPVTIHGGTQTEEQRQKILESLMAAGRDSARSVRAAVMHAMIFAKDTKPDLSAWLKDDDRDVRLAAAEATLQIDPAHKDRFIRALRTMVNDADISITDGMWLSHDVLRIDPEGNKDLVPTFISWLHSDDPEVRSRVAGLLGSLGPHARDALSILETQFQRGQPGERLAMAGAILDINYAAGERVAQAIVSLVNDPAQDPRNRAEAARLVRRHFLSSRTRANSR